LDIGSIIPYLEQRRGGGLFWGDPELLPRIGLAFAIFRLEDVQRLANSRQDEHVRPGR
jgi:hypothetical protein